MVAEKPKKKAQGKAPKRASRKAKVAAVEPTADDAPKTQGPVWDERFIGVASALVGSGHDELGVAKALGCSVEDIRWWREEYPKFDAAFTKMGRPTEYSDALVAIGRKLAELGATDLQLAQAFEVSVRTIYRWRVEHPEFDEALRIGKEQADELVEQSLFKRATGYTYDAQKVFMVEGEVKRVEVLEHVPPDVKAAIMWLLNRRSGQWRNPSHIKHDVDPTSPLANWLANIRPQAITPKDGAIDEEAGAEPPSMGLQVKG